MLGLPEILLRRLNLGEHRRLLERAEERMERLARHEVDRAVLHLHEHVRLELAIELGELDVGALGTIGIDVLVVDERAPDDVAAVRRDRVGEAVRAFGMVAAVVLRSGLPFRVGLDEEAAEVRHERVDLVRLRLPPVGDRGIERIGRLQPAEPDRRGEIRREIRRGAPYGRKTSASALTFCRYSGVRISTFALTLLITVALMPTEACARA